MPENWADIVTDRIAGENPSASGTFLFLGAAAHTVDLRALAVRASFRTVPENTVGRLVGMTDDMGQDVAIGLIERWQREKAQGTIRAPRLDMQHIRCLTIGDVRVSTPFGWS